jgi:hypothetical protein
MPQKNIKVTQVLACGFQLLLCIEAHNVKREGFLECEIFLKI